MFADSEDTENSRDARFYTLAQYFKEDYQEGGRHPESQEVLSKHQTPIKMLCLDLLTVVDAKQVDPPNLWETQELASDLHNRWNILALEPEEASGEWQIVRSCDVKVIKDTAQVVKIRISSEQSLVIRQVCQYIVIDDKPRVILPVYYENFTDLCRLDVSDFTFHLFVIDRVGRVHCVCQTKHLDPKLAKECNLPFTVVETKNAIKLPDECCFYDDYYAMTKATRTLRYPNTSNVWVTKETCKGHPSAPFAAETQYEVRSLAKQMTVQKPIPMKTATPAQSASLPSESDAPEGIDDLFIHTDYDSNCVLEIIESSDSEKGDGYTSSTHSDPLPDWVDLTQDVNTAVEEELFLPSKSHSSVRGSTANNFQASTKKARQTSSTKRQRTN